MSASDETRRAFETAVTHHQAGRLAQADGLYRRVLAAQPRHAHALHLLGLVQLQAGRHEAAVELISRALELDPRNAAARLNLGESYRARKLFNEAAEHYRQALTLQPDYPEAHNNLGLVQKEQGRPEEACGSFERALASRPDFAEAHNNLARALKASGRIDEAASHYRRAAELRPTDAQMGSNLIFALHFQPGLDPHVLEEEYRRWNSRHAAPLRQNAPPRRNVRDPERRLKVGYVSADFRQHPVSFFLYPLLRAHDPRQVAVYGYASVKQPDGVTQGLKSLATVWRDVRALSDAELADQVRADGIDILVDLGMHAANSRLLTFARRPAPLQVSWLAYPGTTGLDAIDYRLSDARMDPPGEAAASSLGGEAVRLPDGWCCYHPLGETPPVADLPASKEPDGAVTFGCLNSFNKINISVLRRWAAALAALPESRLLLHAPAEESIHRRVRATLAEGGVTGDRVEFIGTQGRQQYLRTYGRIDIGLDPFPFNGMTTTCEALWMGVPVLAWPGDTPGSRVGASLLASVGLEELVARSQGEYVAVATALARDLPRLAGLRRGLRARMEASPLMDGPRFSRHVEAAYRAMWRRWLASGRP